MKLRPAEPGQSVVAGPVGNSPSCPCVGEHRRRSCPVVSIRPVRPSGTYDQTPPNPTTQPRTRRHTREATVAHRSGGGNCRRHRAVRSVLVRRRKGTHFAGRARPAGKAASRDSAFSRSRVKGRFHVPAPLMPATLLLSRSVLRSLVTAPPRSLQSALFSVLSLRTSPCHRCEQG